MYDMFFQPKPAHVGSDFTRQLSIDATTAFHFSLMLKYANMEVKNQDSIKTAISLNKRHRHASSCDILTVDSLKFRQDSCCPATSRYSIPTAGRNWRFFFLLHRCYIPAISLLCFFELLEVTINLILQDLLP